MTSKMIRRALVLLFGMAVLIPAGPALAQTAPPNDDFNNATVASALPFTDNIDTTGATAAADDPTDCSVGQPSVWYSFTPSQSGPLSVSTVGSSYGPSVTVYTGTRGNLKFVNCGGTNPSPMTFLVTAGTTYFFMVTSCCGAGSGGQLVFNLSAPPQPANDDFASATPIGALPFNVIVDTSGATFESGEPAPTCFNEPPQGTVWYAFTPTVSESVTTSDDASFGVDEAIYTGTSLGHLTAVQCGNGGQSTIHVTAGTTYYFQVGDFINGSGPLTFHLDVSPPPTADFVLNPSDPSIFDTIQFIDESSDPANAGISAETWHFGDGATGTGENPTHQYAADGSYTVKLTITTTDGRKASTSQVVQVSTHDVAITTFTVPSSSKPGKTHLITVGVSDNRYPETVQVQLLASDSHGNFDVVGTLTQSITVKPGKRTTPFAFSYTFTSADAKVGKVTFEAIATIQGPRDALPDDNTAIASTIVR
jgi:PKD repeat protein